MVMNESEEKNLLYVGPTIAGVAIQNTVYAEIPNGARAAFQECAQLRNLFVPVREYGTAEGMLRTRSGYIYSAFCKALEYGKRKVIR